MNEKHYQITISEIQPGQSRGAPPEHFATSTFTASSDVEARAKGCKVIRQFLDRSKK